MGWGKEGGEKEGGEEVSGFDLTIAWVGGTIVGSAALYQLDRLVAAARDSRDILTQIQVTTEANESLLRSIYLELNRRVE